MSKFAPSEAHRRAILTEVLRALRSSYRNAKRWEHEAARMGDDSANAGWSYRAEGVERAIRQVRLLRDDPNGAAKRRAARKTVKP